MSEICPPLHIFVLLRYDISATLAVIYVISFFLFSPHRLCRGVFRIIISVCVVAKRPYGAGDLFCRRKKPKLDTLNMEEFKMCLIDSINLDMT